MGRPAPGTAAAPLVSGRSRPLVQHMSILQEIGLAASRLGRHPHDHGWRQLYQLFGYGLERSAPALVDTILTYRGVRASSSAAHLVTLLGIAVKAVDPGRFDRLVGTGQDDLRLQILERVLTWHQEEIGRILSVRQNSFTAARRFLVPQALLGASLFQMPGRTVNFVDLGTGLGVLPRQLNSTTLYERFIGDLVWPDRQPAFTRIPLASRFGVDRGPLPDLGWVHSCYGSSGYYDDMYQELLMTLRCADVRRAVVRYVPLDLLDRDAVAQFVRRYRINAVNLCYVLYELTAPRRRELIDLLADVLRPPRIIVAMEPQDELTGPGCTVTYWDESLTGQLEVCAVSDGHFRGRVVPRSGYTTFVDRYPIPSPR